MTPNNHIAEVAMGLIIAAQLFFVWGLIATWRRRLSDGRRAVTILLTRPQTIIGLSCLIISTIMLFF